MCIDNFCFFFFNDTATTEIYTLSLHDALPIWETKRWPVEKFAEIARRFEGGVVVVGSECERPLGDRKSTRLNSSHVEISYAVFCLKKKKKKKIVVLVCLMIE